MLNLQALADIVMGQIIAATKIPKPVFAGEVQVATGEVEDKSYFGLLSEKQVYFEPFVRRFFIRDINLRKILYDVPDYEVDYGIRQALNKLDEQEFRRGEVSNALAMTAIATINECRSEMHLPLLSGEEGEIILGLIPFYTDEANNAQEGGKGTKDQSVRGKDLQKNKTAQGTNKMRENKKQIKDGFDKMRRELSVDKICELMEISKPTYYKLEKWTNENE